MNKITLSVQGMKCPMCESRACDALRKAFPKVKSVNASHKDARIVILSEDPLAEDALRAALASTPYEVGQITFATEKKKGLLGLFS